MARPIKEIYEEILQGVADSPVLSAKLTSPSKTAIYKLWAYIVAGAISFHERVFDNHRVEMEEFMDRQHAHTLRWYTERAKEFMYGKQLVPFTRDYDTAGMTPEDIIAAQIITYAACVRVRRESGRLYLLLKVAKGSDELKPLNTAELEAFKGYIHAIQDAGVDVDCMSNEADRIKMKWKVYYDPQIINAAGDRVDGTAQGVVRSAIVYYLKALSFNGAYIPTHHVDHLQKIGGVIIPVLQSAELSSDGGATWVAAPDDGITPSAGWCKVYADGDLKIEMIPYNSLK